MSSALSQAFGELTARIATHGENLLADYQPYDLHQFRVNIRRTRSILKQMKSRPAGYFRRSWGSIFAVTNPARDLDVFLESSRALLPVEQSSLLEPLLLPRVRASHGAVTKILQSPRLKRHMAGWRGYLVTLENRAEHLPHAPLSKAMKRARKACRRALRTGEDVDWHRFRIAVKNLRYVADTNAADPHADQDDLEALIEACKTLQEHLGDWHDTVVQLRLINSGELEQELQATPELAEVRAGLDQALHREKVRLLDQTRETLAQQGMFSA